MKPTTIFQAARIAGLAATAILALAVAGAQAQAQMSKQQITGKIERDLGVTVLRIAPAAAMGGNVLAVTVMNPPGDFNEAFQVNTIAVDANTGTLVPLERQTPEGYHPSAPPATFRTSPRTAEMP